MYELSLTIIELKAARSSGVEVIVVTSSSLHKQRAEGRCLHCTDMGAEMFKVEG